MHAASARMGETRFANPPLRNRWAPSARSPEFSPTTKARDSPSSSLRFVAFRPLQVRHHGKVVGGVELALVCRDGADVLDFEAAHQDPVDAPVGVAGEVVEGFVGAAA